MNLFDKHLLGKILVYFFYKEFYKATFKLNFQNKNYKAYK